MSAEEAARLRAALARLNPVGMAEQAETVEVPVGVVTAMIGGPFFLWLLVRKG